MDKQKLFELIKQYRSFLCIGLDPDTQKIPKHLLNSEDPIFEFNAAIIDATVNYCIAYKPNFAFYEAYGSVGVQSLEKTIRYIKLNYPDKFIIADAKRGDIGNTSDRYAKSIFEHLSCDAITLSPYMGKDSISPFLKYKDKWAIILCLTSNEGSADFQTLPCADGNPLFIHTIKKSAQWGNINNTMFVVGATNNPSLLKDIRKIIPEHFMLIPGIGAQGGDLNTVCDAALNKDVGIIVNVSRDIIYAASNESFAIAAQIKAQEYQNKMEEILKNKNLI